uniref:Uncharacterized protein n=1 Tax=Rhizophagus irregularis (strain DAOM 181602 / DAOM 197198 / MUCL 43194) TaxID=747089 RepID=U9TF12_RHIID
MLFTCVSKKYCQTSLAAKNLKCKKSVNGTLVHAGKIKVYFLIKLRFKYFVIIFCNYSNVKHPFKVHIWGAIRNDEDGSCPIYKTDRENKVETVGINNNNVKVILMPQKKFFKKIISYRMNDSEGDDENNYDDDRIKVKKVGIVKLI